VRASNLAVLGLGLALAAACGGGGGPCDRNAVGNICTIGGSGENGYDMATEDKAVPATQTPMSLPTDTLTAPDGTVYVVDWNNHRLRKITADGMIHFVAGNGELGGSIDDPAKGNFNHPTNIIFDLTGTLIYISAWHNSKIRILDPATGMISDSCGDGRRAYFGDNGPALTASLDLPSSIAWDPHNNLVILDQANQVIRVIDQAGSIHRMAGNCVVDEAPPTGPGACPGGTAPTACPAPSGKTVCGDPAKFCSVACGPAYSGDEGPALEMRMAQAFGQSADPGGRIAYDKQGNLYFADTANNLIRVIDPQGIVHRVAGQPPPAVGGFSGDGGPALAAALNHPVDISLADDGTIYFTDVLNHCVRAIAPDKTIRTVAGQCGMRLPEDQSVVEGVPATSALLFKPYGVEWVAPHTLYIADSGNNVIRAVHLP
jgi:sugar lactone lactonase YvrE